MFKQKYLNVLLYAFVVSCSAGHVHASVMVTAANGQSLTLGNTTVPLDSNSSIRGLAIASVDMIVFLASPRIPKVGQGGGTAGPASDTGTVPDKNGVITKADALTSFRLSPAGGRVFVGTAGRFARVTAGGELGFATSAIEDPAIYRNAAGQSINLSYGLIGGAYGVQASLGEFTPAEGAMGSSRVSTVAGSDIPGLETLFSLTLSLDASDPTAVNLAFSSNPLLGLDDATIRSDILSRLVFNPADGSYLLSSDFQYASINVVVPTGQNDVSFTWNTEAHVVAVAPVPEPSSFILSGTGVLTLLVYCWRHRMRVAA